MRYFYFIVEGVHDIAAISKYLKINSYTQIRDITALDDFWKRTVPSKFPFNGDLKKRVPVPAFYANDQMSIAIQYSEGDTEIVNTFNSLKNIEYDELDGIAIFCDADNKNAQDRYSQLTRELQIGLDSELSPIIEGHAYNEITKSSDTKFGIYIFPNNLDEGTLENLLLEGAEHSYPELFEKAKDYIEELKSMNISYIKNRLFRGSKENKMIFGIMANIFKPGKANQVSIEDNDWITEATLTLPIQKQFSTFLDTFLN